MIAGVVAFTVVMLFGSVFAPINYSWIWTTDYRFGLSSHGTSIGFSDNIYLESFVFDSGTSIDFINVKMDNDNVDDITFGSQTCNATITSLSDTRLDYNVTGAGTQTVSLENKLPLSVIIDGSLAVNGFGYTYSGSTITVTGATSDVVISFRTDNLVATIAAIASLINNTYTAIALIILVPIVIIASLVLVACREQLDSQTLILAVVGTIVLAVAVMVLLVVLPSLQIM